MVVIMAVVVVSAVLGAVAVAVIVVIVAGIRMIVAVVLVGVRLVGHGRRLTSCAYLRMQAISRWEPFATARNPQAAGYPGA